MGHLKINVTPSTSEGADTTGGALGPFTLLGGLHHLSLSTADYYYHHHLSLYSHPSANNTHVCRRGNSLLTRKNKKNTIEIEI